MVWEYIRTDNIHRSLFHGSAPSTNHQDHLLDRHYNNVAEIMSSVCDWAHLDLCLKPQGPVSLIKCMEDGCNRVLHHMCQCTWESDDEDVRQSHGSRMYCAHHHPTVAKGQYHAETGPPSNLLQGFSQSTMETMSTITTATSLPPMVKNINITDQSLPADGQEDVFNHQEDENDDEQLPPLQRIWDCPYIEKISLDGSVYGAVMCLSLSMLHVPIIM
jgi:hypothetical protein